MFTGVYNWVVIDLLRSTMTVPVAVILGLSMQVSSSLSVIQVIVTYLLTAL